VCTIIISNLRPGKIECQGQYGEVWGRAVRTRGADATPLAISRADATPLATYK